MHIRRSRRYSDGMRLSVLSDGESPSRHSEGASSASGEARSPCPSRDSDVDSDLDDGSETDASSTQDRSSSDTVMDIGQSTEDCEGPPVLEKPKDWGSRGTEPQWRKYDWRSGVSAGVRPPSSAAAQHVALFEAMGMGSIAGAGIGFAAGGRDEVDRSS